MRKRTLVLRSEIPIPDIIKSGRAVLQLLHKLVSACNAVPWKVFCVRVRVRVRVRVLLFHEPVLGAVPH